MATDYGAGEAYQGFARVYDEMMASRDYRVWADYVADLAGDYGVRPPVICWIWPVAPGVS